jgi:hypothetical protein
MYHKKQSQKMGGGGSDAAAPGQCHALAACAQLQDADGSSSADLGTPLLAHFSQSIVILPCSLFISYFSSVLSFLLFIFIVLSVFFLYYSLV